MLGNKQGKKKDLILNILTSIAGKVVAILLGLVLPRLMLVAYGSKVNGLVSSISQMLSVIAFLDMGVGAVVQIALYKPLAEKNYLEVAAVYNESKRYFTTIAKILLGYIVALGIYYCLLKDTGFSALYVVTLLIAIAIDNVAQYFFSINTSLLLTADQKIFVINVVNTLTQLLNFIAAVVLIKLGVGIQVVKFSTSIIYLIRPIVFYFYSKRHYDLGKYSKNVSNNTEMRLKNKWSGGVQHITTMLSVSIDYIILTMTSDIALVSVYNVYVMPLKAIKDIVDGISTSYKSFFGQMLAKDKNEVVLQEFRRYEIIIHYAAALVFLTVNTVLISFVLLYTKGVNDINYKDELFSVIICISYLLFTVRIIYTTIIFAAGHLYETRWICIIESVINIFVSFTLVFPLGITGVAIGTCASLLYRIIASVYYLSQNILYRPVKVFVLQVFQDLCVCGGIILIDVFFTLKANTFLFWFVESFGVFIINSIWTAIVFVIFGNFKKVCNVKQKGIK